MRRIFVENGWFRKCLEFMARQIEKWVVKYVGIPIITVIPPAIATYIVKSAAPSENETSSLLQTIYTFVHDYPLSIVIGAALYLIAGKALINFILIFGKKDEGIDAVGLLTLFDVLEKIVSAKAKRFGATASLISQNNNSVPSSDIFGTITQPDQQIALLVNSLHAFFDSIDKDGVSFRVSLVSIDADKNPIEWFYYYPESDPPRITLEQLGEEDSALSCCIKRKHIVIIEDIAKEAAKDVNRHYIPNEGDLSVEGSLICYPIIHHHTGSDPYVLTIVADKKDYFCETKKKLYKWILQHFAVRIGLEHSLCVIKKEVSNDN